MSTIKLKPINTEDLEKETQVENLVIRSKDLVIANQEQLVLAALLLIDVKNRYKELDAQRKTITNPMDAAKKAVMDLFRNPLTKLEKAEEGLKKAIMKYDDERKEIARIEQARVQKLIDQENAKQQKLIDQKIERAEAAGKIEKVEDLILQKENIIPIAAPVVAPKIEKPSSVSYKITYAAEVVDINLVPREYLVANIQALTKIGQATKGTISIPGVKFTEVKTLASRG